MFEDILYLSRYILPALALIIFFQCIVALLRRRPPSLGSAKLIHNTPQREVYQLVTRETSIGRNKKCDIVLTDPTVSRLHAVVVCAKDGWYVADVKSQAGVLLNGKQIEKKAFIKTGDRITLGADTLTFENLQE